MAIQITYRETKGSPLTNNEVDANFRALAQAGDSAASEIAELDQDVATAQSTADAAQVKLVPGANITIDDSDPLAPVISANGGGGTGTVQTVAGVPPVEGDILAPTLISALGIDQKLNSSQKGQPNGVATLDINSLIPVSQLPSYVDDVLEFFTLAAMPRPGQSGKIYIALNTNKQYRWPEAGSDYVELVASPGTTDAIVEGTVNKWWTNARTLASVLTGIVFTTGTAITATDSVLSAFGKLQKQISDAVASLLNKANNGINADITQLNSIDGTGYNTLRAGLPVMTGATASAVGVKGLVPTPAAGDQLKFLRADGTWVTVTSSAAWGSISGLLSAQTDLQAALDAKGSIITKETVTAGQGWANGGQVNFTHTSGQPKSVTIELVFKQAVAGMTVGQILAIGFGAYYVNSTYYGCDLRKLTPTSAQIQIGAGGLYCYDATGATFAVTPAMADLRLRILG